MTISLVFTVRANPDGGLTAQCFAPGPAGMEPLLATLARIRARGEVIAQPFLLSSGFSDSGYEGGTLEE